MTAGDTGSGASCLYAGQVVHRRIRPRRHRFRYRVFSFFLDLDEVDDLGARLRLFSHNGRGLTGFFDRDHGSGGAGLLRSWVEELLARAGILLDGGPIRLLCYPRVLGYVFNPLSVYYCYRAGGRLAAILYEVNNTFGERHCYLIPVKSGGAGPIRQACPKRFYVSPFIEVAGNYAFRLSPPGERLSVAICQRDAQGDLLQASFVGRRLPLDDSTILRCVLGSPLMTLKVMGGIHWEAARLWLKGIPLMRRPGPPCEPVTIVRQKA